MRLLSVDDDSVDNGACANSSPSQHCRPDIFIILIIKMREKKKLTKILNNSMLSNKSNITLILLSDRNYAAVDTQPWIQHSMTSLPTLVVCEFVMRLNLANISQEIPL